MPSPISAPDASPAPPCCGLAGASERRERRTESTLEVAAAVAVHRPGPVGEQQSQSRDASRRHRPRRVQPQGDLRRFDPLRRRCWARSSGTATTAARRDRRHRATARRSERAMASRSSTDVNRAACTASALPAGAGTPTASIRSNLPAEAARQPGGQRRRVRHDLVRGRRIWAVERKPIEILFPLMVLVLFPLRSSRTCDCQKRYTGHA